MNHTMTPSGHMYQTIELRATLTKPHPPWAMCTTPLHPWLQLRFFRTPLGFCSLFPGLTTMLFILCSFSIKSPDLVKFIISFWYSRAEQAVFNILWLPGRTFCGVWCGQLLPIVLLQSKHSPCRDKSLEKTWK